MCGTSGKKSPNFQMQESLRDTTGNTGKGLQLLWLADIAPRALQLIWHQQFKLPWRKTEWSGLASNISFIVWIRFLNKQIGSASAFWKVDLKKEECNIMREIMEKYGAQTPWWVGFFSSHWSFRKSNSRLQLYSGKVQVYKRKARPSNKNEAWS